MRGRQFMEWLWGRLNGSAFLKLSLVLVGLISLVSLWLPQAPVPFNETAAFSRWVASIHTRLDPYTEQLAAWGLLSLKTTLWLRLPLALLGLIVAARAAMLYERWRDLAHFTRTRQALLVLGLLGILSGWVIQLRWGWSETGIHAWPGEEVILPRSSYVLPPVGDGPHTPWHGFGLFVFRDEPALGLDIQARNEDGEIVPLLLSSQSAAQEKIRLILSHQLPDGYFGIPEADLVFRVTLQQTLPTTEFQTQIYRSSSGALITETTLRGGGVIFADKIQLQLDSLSVFQLRAVYNPGAPVTFAGWCLVAISAVLVLVEQRKHKAPQPNEA